MARTIQSPGVEVKEVDLSLRPNLPVGTTVFIPGFANQGPTDELLTISSLSEFEQVYGLPQNSAERYMYHTVKAVFQSPANVLVSRLPYGTGAGATVADKYSVQVYPVIPRPIMVDAANADVLSIEKDERMIAWFPADAEEVDERGDVVLSQSASANLVDGNQAPTTVAKVLQKGALYNDYTLRVIPGAGSDLFQLNGTEFTIQVDEATINGATVTNLINTHLGTQLYAEGGLDDTIGTYNANHTDVTTGLVSAVEINTVEAGALNTFTIVGEAGEIATLSANVTPGDPATLVEATANTYGADNNVDLTGRDAVASTFTGVVSADKGLGAGLEQIDITITANAAGAAGNTSNTYAFNNSDALSNIFSAHAIVETGTATDASAYVVQGNTAGDDQTIALTGGADVPTAQDLLNEQFGNGIVTATTGGGVSMPNSTAISFTGGRDPYTVDQLVANANGTVGAGDHTAVVVAGGGTTLNIGDTITVQGAFADDTISTDTSFSFAGGVDRRLSKKVIPFGEWRFGETSPGAGYVATTLKDAVDSVIAGLDYRETFGVPLSTYVDDAGDGDRFWQVTNQDLVDSEGATPDFGSVPALQAYEAPEVADLVATAVNSVGWDLSASDRYYLGEPSNIELDNDRFQKTIKGEIKLSGHNAGKFENQKFTSFEDLISKGGAGMMIVNDKKYVINEKFEGYYLGISDNTNLNPATDFDSVGKLKSLSKRLGGTTGGYVNVPDESEGLKSRLTFSLSAGFLFDEFGNKQQVGLDGSMSEVLENLSEFDLNTDEFSDILTIAVFKVRQSTLEPDATKLDYLVSDSVIGSVNYFRERFLSTGGTATSYFIESEAENSNNLYLKFNEGISKDAGNWLDENGYPTRKIRVMPSKDVRYYAEIESEADKIYPQEVTDFKVTQAFLNDTELKEDRLYIKSWQGLMRSKTAQVKHGNNVYPHGVYRQQLAAAKETGNIPAKLDRIFELADNFDLFPIDITCEGGLGTIYVGSDGGTNTSYDDEEYYNIGEFIVSSTGLSGNGLYTTKLIDNRSSMDFMVNYDVIFDTFKSFSQFQRKDNIFIADPLRYIFVQGKNSKILTSKQRQAGVNFSQHIYWPLRHMMTGGAKNSSYCTTYANWGFTNDKALNRGVWVPMSGFAAAAMANTDSNFYPWVAPAGFTRGLVSGIQDLAFFPKQKERDQLYKIGLNPITNFPNEGYAIFGQKTMQAKPSAFDRINVRRLFLYLQKATMNTVKYFVFEPNTLFTRTQVLNVLRPIFEEVKNTQGMYDYLLVCDERNNSPDVIDRNELVIDIYIKPTRAAEFILVNFYATRTGQDFSELVA